MKQVKWTEHPVILPGKKVTLLPLEKEHFTALTTLASKKAIWTHYIFDMSDSVKLTANLEAALAERQAGLQYPFVIQHNATGKIIGSTRFLDIKPEHRKLEIGWTWLHPDYWGTGINEECKLLLLGYCFEQLNAVRVLLKTDAQNTRSRRAIEKIGGQFEGILRNDMVRENGTLRNSAYYSVINGEWPDVKQRIKELLKE